MSSLINKTNDWNYMNTQEALKMIQEHIDMQQYDHAWDRCQQLIEALATNEKSLLVQPTVKESLKVEQPAQEPVAWATEWEDGEWSVSHSPNMGKQSIPLYTNPTPAQEPVAWNEEEFNAIAYAYRTCPAHEIKMVSDRYQELVNYVLSITHPAPAWQGLSDDEIIDMYFQASISPQPHQSIINFIRAIEQALKEKNT